MRRATGSGTRVDTAMLAVCVFLALLLKAFSPELREGFAAVLRGTVLAPLLALQESSERWRTALGSHDAIIAARDSALLLALQIPALEAENERLARFQMLGSRLKWGFIPAQALQDASLSDFTTITLTAGAKQGVKPLAAVIAPEGLVGFVRTVDENTSVANLWTAAEFAVSAMSEDRSATGIVTPHLGAGADRYLLELRYVGFRHNLRIGTRIVATGFGGVYPELVPIGTVVRDIGTSGDWARTYLVRPDVMPQDIAFVMILQPERSAAGVAGVWDSEARRDSMYRTIIAKGDSIARARYDAEVRAAVDSSLALLRAQALNRDTTPVKPPPVAAEVPR